MNLIISRYIESSIHISGKERGGGAGKIPRQWVSFMETKRANLIPTIGAKSDVIKRINEARSLVPPSFRVDGLRNNEPGALTIENNVQTPPCIPDIAGRYYARSFYSLSLVNVFRCARHFAGRGARGRWGSEGRPPPPISRVPRFSCAPPFSWTRGMGKVHVAYTHGRERKVAAVSHSKARARTTSSSRWQV